mmetsp:Transcript_93800/g.201398  ORF Transcript_93800/g.201398 Transcript_93800/m.201398 type:complete len:424 (+) Transcript_93800:101-1372(+)
MIKTSAFCFLTCAFCAILIVGHVSVLYPYLTHSSRPGRRSIESIRSSIRRRADLARSSSATTKLPLATSLKASATRTTTWTTTWIHDAESAELKKAKRLAEEAKRLAEAYRKAAEIRKQEIRTLKKQLAEKEKLKSPSSQKDEEVLLEALDKLRDASKETSDTSSLVKTPTDEVKIFSYDFEFLSAIPPVFVHVPRAAGQAILRGLWNSAELNEDFESFKHARHHVLDDTRCAPHGPPSWKHIPGGFAVVREPLERLASGFCRARSLGKVSDGPLTCDMFNEWVSAVLNSYKSDPGIEQCQWIPQWCYAARAEYVIPMSRDLQSTIRLLHPSVARLTLEIVNAQHAPNRTSSEWKSGPCEEFGITPSCLNASNLIAVQEHFSIDFQHLGPLFKSLGQRGASGVYRVQDTMTAYLDAVCPKMDA